MENKIIFREILSEIKEAADEAGGVITREKVRKHLERLPLEEEHYQMIYSYLEEQGIRVPETEEEAGELAPEREGRSLELYLEELQQLEERSGEEEQELLHRLLAGEAQAKEKLIEWYLPLICEMAGEYEGGDLPVEDLIQEGNIGFLTALDQAMEYESIAACRAHFLNSISQAMEDAIREGQEARKRGDGIVSRVNHLNEAVKNLEEDLGRKVSLEELSAYLEMPAEEIRDILRLSGDQIELM